MQRLALMHCNAGGGYGIGHLMRSITIAHAARARGWAIELGGDIDEAASRIARRHGIDAERVALRSVPTWLAKRSAALEPSVVHLDTYWLGSDQVPRGTHIVSNVQDAEYGVRDADFVIDANFGADEWFEHQADRAELIGVRGAMIREDVLRHRTRPKKCGDRHGLLVVFGGTDPHHVTEQVIEAVSRMRTALQVTVVCQPEDASRIESRLESTAHDAEVCAFLPDLPRVARDKSLAISAAGTTVLELACLGTPMAIACVADNQRAGYEAITRAGLAKPIGVPPFVDAAALAATLDSLLDDDEWRHQQSRKLRQTVDGLGAWRVVATWDQLREHGAPRESPSTELLVRPASEWDSDKLFAWRNDPAVRSVSRSPQPVLRDVHDAWLQRALATQGRRLLVVEARGEPIATVRWDEREDGWEVSITVGPEARGRGVGSSVLAIAEASLLGTSPTRLIATIHDDNRASRRLFARAGYLPDLPADREGFGTYAKLAFPAKSLPT